MLWLCLPFALLRLVLKSRNNPSYRKRIAERLSFNLPKLNGCILVHAVSVGETIAAKPLIEELLLDHPHREILVTSTTPTGSDRVIANFGHRVVHCFLPFDTRWFTSRFIKSCRPAVVIIIETEIWPNLIDQCYRRSIPVILANARMSARSYKGYQKFRTLSRPTLRKITRIAAHAQPDAARFLALGVAQDHLLVTGSLKFDLEIPPTLAHQADNFKQSFGRDRFIWVAASTHEGEEDQIVQAVVQINAHCNNALCLIVPRHSERFDTVHRLLEQSQLPFVRLSEIQIPDDEIPQETQIVLCDTMGQLLLFYALANAAFVGGSLVQVGGHNVLESLASNTATIVGPHMFNFQSIHDLLRDAQAIIEVQNAHELAASIIRLYDDKQLEVNLSARGHQVIQKNRGALERLVTLIRQQIE